MHKSVVAVLRGGPSNEYEVSLKTGKTVLDNLPVDHYSPVDIFIDRNGVWHKCGIPLDPYDALRHVDVVFNALHGPYGEDGKVQRLLEKIGMPYTGSGAFASSVGMNKLMTKNVFKTHGIKTPYHKILTVEDVNPERLTEIFRTFPHPAVTKPYNSGSSHGVSIVHTFEDLKRGLASAFEHAPKVIIEEYIPGKEGTIGVVENFRGQDLYTLFPVEIRPHNKFFDYEAKYQGKCDEICPGSFGKDDLKIIEELGRAVHRSMGLRHYSRTDFIINPRRGIYALEVNTLPGLTEESLLPKSLKAVGVELPDFLHHVVTLAHKKPIIT